MSLRTDTCETLKIIKAFTRGGNFQSEFFTCIYYSADLFSVVSVEHGTWLCLVHWNTALRLSVNSNAFLIRPDLKPEHTLSFLSTAVLHYTGPLQGRS